VLQLDVYDYFDAAEYFLIEGSAMFGVRPPPIFVLSRVLNDHGVFREHAAQLSSHLITDTHTHTQEPMLYNFLWS
jgi:hypothetical protein